MRREWDITEWEVVGGIFTRAGCRCEAQCDVAFMSGAMLHKRTCLSAPRSRRGLCRYA